MTEPKEMTGLETVLENVPDSYAGVSRPADITWLNPPPVPQWLDQEEDDESEDETLDELINEYKEWANNEDQLEEERRHRWLQILKCGLETSGHVWGETHCLNCNIPIEQWNEWEEKASVHNLEYCASDGLSYCTDEGCNFIYLEGINV